MPPIDPNIIGWILTIAIVAFGYGKIHKTVDLCMKKLENGLPEEVKDHGERLTRIETVIEYQEAQGNRMETKFDMLLERSGINPADWARIKTQVDCQEKVGSDKLP